MSDSTKKRIIAEASLAKRFETEINERASTADIPALIDNAKTLFPAASGEPAEPVIALDEDGVPYVTIGD